MLKKVKPRPHSPINKRIFRHQHSQSHLPSILDSLHSTVIQQPTYSLAKFHRKMTPSAVPALNPHEKSLNLTKSLSKEEKAESTEASAERSKEILMMEAKLLDCGSKSNSLKYITALEVCEELSVTNNVLQRIMKTIKEYLEDYVTEVKREASACLKNQAEFFENKQTLKILKKRFQKLAIENLEIQNELNEKEGVYLEAKERCKQLTRDAREKATKYEMSFKCFKEETEILIVEIEKLKLVNRSLLDKLRECEKCFEEIGRLSEGNSQLKTMVESIRFSGIDEEFTGILGCSLIEPDAGHHSSDFDYRKSLSLASAQHIEFLELQEINK